MTLLLPFLAAFGASLLLTPAIRGIARSVGLIARPSQDRWHAKPTALLGGAAVYGGLLAGVAAIVISAHGGIDALAAVLGRPGLGMLIASSLMFFVGLTDDRFHLKPATKLIFQGLAAAIVISFGVVYPVTNWEVVNVLVTFFWFLALTNALNLLDNMDGVAAGVAAVAAIFLAVTFYLDGQIVLAALCLSLAGATLGFLPFNFHRASIFMGDSGSLFIGSLLASLAAAYPGTASAGLVAVLFVPAAIVIIPILDTLLVTVARTLAGRPISEGGRDHTTHRLVAMGLSESQVALLLYAFAACGGLVAMALRGAPEGIGLAVGGIFLVALLALAAYLGQMHTYTHSDPPRGGVTFLISNFLYKRRAFEVLLDLILFLVAYQFAYLLRWDGSLPGYQRDLFASTVAIAAGAKLVAFGALGVYRGVWNQLNLRDAIRLVQATIVGSLLTVVVLTFVFPGAPLSRSVLILDGILVVLLATATRASFRTLDLVRHALQSDGEPALIYGAGKAGELVVRELLSNSELQMKPIGFLDDDPSKLRRLVQGYPVFGNVSAAGEILRMHSVKHVILCSRSLSPERIDMVRQACSSRDIGVWQVELTFQRLGKPSSIASMARDEIPRLHQPKVALHSAPVRAG